MASSGEISNQSLKPRKIERLMLIYPPVNFSHQSLKQCHVPLGLSYLAAVMREECEVGVLDAAVEGYAHEQRVGPGLMRYGLSFDDIQRRIEEFQPDMVGVSCIFSSQFVNTVEVCRRAKKINPNIITITGGTHPTFLSEHCLSEPALDLVVRGEGEFTLRDTVQTISRGDSLAEVEGLAFKDNGKVVINPDRKPYPNLDELPFPAREMFPLEKYHKISQPMGIVYERRPFMNLITSRGCAYHCTFCSSTNFWGNCYRPRSAENVLAEMEHLYHDLGIREFKFFDDNLTSDKDRAKAIFQGMIDRGIDVTWNTPNGIHIVTLDEDMLDLMKRCGCYELTLAVESGDPDVLKRIIRKPTKLEQVEESAKLIRQKGIGSYGFFIIGFPGETKAQIANTLNFARKIDLDRISVFVANPLPGTEMYEVAKKNKYISEDYDYDRIDYFEGLIDTPEWSHEEIHKLRSNWFWKYNLSAIIRHPVRSLGRYKILLTRPELIWEILKRNIRGMFEKN